MSVVTTRSQTPLQRVQPDGTGTAGERPRDPFIDLVRSVALFVVVIWHWSFTTIRWSEDGPHVGNPVAATPGMWVATWFLQIMPAFFIVGGHLHRETLERSSEAPTAASRRAFWVNRSRRLVLPVLPLVVPALVLIGAFAATGRSDLVRGVILVISPMWFLGTYLVCVALAPMAARANHRFGPWSVVIGTALVAIVDITRIGLGIGGALTGTLAFVFVWGTVHQLGFSLDRLRKASRRTQAAVMMGGYTLLAISAVAFPYPAAMVGLDGHKLSNMGPPTIMVVFLGAGQIGMLCLLEPWLRGIGLRFRSQLTKAGEWSMTVYAWHLVAYALFWFLLVCHGVEVGSTVDATWWLQRPIWVIGPILLAIPLCRLTRRFDPTRP